MKPENQMTLAEIKEHYGVQTHYCEGQGWMALAMPRAIQYLSDSDLDEEEKSDLSAIVASYGVLLDEIGLLVDGEETESEAVGEAIAAALMLKL